MKEDEFFNGYDCGVLFFNGCYSLSLPDNVFIDAEIFEDYVKKAESCKNDNIENAIECYEKAIELYGGDYFPNCSTKTGSFQNAIITAEFIYNHC